MQQQHATCTLVSMFLLHPAPTCANRCWCLVPLTFSNLCRWCFSFQQLAQILYQHLWWLPSATCTGGHLPSSTGTYNACTYCNLHCVVVVVCMYVVVVGACGDAGYMWMRWQAICEKPAFGRLSCSDASQTSDCNACIQFWCLTVQDVWKWWWVCLNCQWGTTALWYMGYLHPPQ